jgi:DNA-binding beta-propeller fold protein YncE
VYVADLGNNRVEIFNSKGTYLSQFGSKGTGNGQFYGPYGVAIDPSRTTCT